MDVLNQFACSEDFDNDGYLSLSDLRSACEKFKIPNSSAFSQQSDDMGIHPWSM